MESVFGGLDLAVSAVQMTWVGGRKAGQGSVAAALSVLCLNSRNETGVGGILKKEGAPTQKV